MSIALWLCNHQSPVAGSTNTSELDVDWSLCHTGGSLFLNLMANKSFFFLSVTGKGTLRCGIFFLDF